MKAILLTLSLLTIFTAAGHALDIKTPDGTLKDVVVKKVVGESVSVMHSEGTALVDFDLLPPAMQLEYGWTPEKSAARKAAKEAEIKRIADEEKMAEEAPKRKAMEEEAKKIAAEEKVAAEERAKMRAVNADFEAESAKAQKDLIEEAAKVRAQIDRERNGGKAGKEEPPVATVVGDSVKEVTVASAPRAVIAKPAFGTVSEVISTENPFLKNYKVWIGLGIGLAVVLVLFMLPSSNSVKRGRRR